MELKLEAFGKVIFKLNLAIKVVGGGPGFGKSKAVLLVRVLGLKFTVNNPGFAVLISRDFENLTKIRDCIAIKSKPAWK